MPGPKRNAAAMVVAGIFLANAHPAGGIRHLFFEGEVEVPGLSRPVSRKWLDDHRLGHSLETTGLRDVRDIPSLGGANTSSGAVASNFGGDLAWLERHAPRSGSNLARPTYLQHLPDAWLQDRQPLKDAGSIPVMELPSTSRPTLVSPWHLRFHRALRRHGAVLLRGVPTTEDDGVQQQALERVLPLFDSDYGRVWVTQGYGIADEELHTTGKNASWLAERVEGNARRRLEQHTDSSFWSAPAGLIFFHMVHPASGGGGESTLVDGFAAAEALRATDPGAFKTLCEVEVRFKYKPVALEYYYMSSATVLRAHPKTGALLQVRWSNKDRAVMTVPRERAAAFYEAYEKLAALMEGTDEYRITLGLQPGTVLALDNWRMTHGREAYVGKRTLYGAYVLRDVVDASQRLLEDVSARGGLGGEEEVLPDGADGTPTAASAPAAAGSEAKPEAATDVDVELTASADRMCTTRRQLSTLRFPGPAPPHTCPGVGRARA